MNLLRSIRVSGLLSTARPGQGGIAGARAVDADDAAGEAPRGDIAGAGRGDIANAAERAAIAETSGRAAIGTDTVAPEGPTSRGARLLGWLDRATAPLPDTHGNFKKPPYVPAMLIGGIEGFALCGVGGVLTGAAAAASSVCVEHHSGSNLLGVATGAAVGAAMAAMTFPAHSLTARLVVGGLMGGFQAYRGNKIADVRGAGSFGALVAAACARGPAKVAGGIAAAASAHFARGRHPAIQAALGATLGAGLGLGVAALGFAPIGLPAFTAICAVSGAIGPLLGPRYSQMFRNLSQRCGTAIEARLLKSNRIGKPFAPHVRNCLGALPAGASKEGLTGLIYADGHISGLVAGTLVESIHLVAVFLLMDRGKTSAPPQK